MNLRGQIAGLIGAEKTEALCLHFGGISQYIPNSPTPNHRFLAYIDERDLAAICDHVGGTTITLPKSKRAFKQALIKDLLAEGELSVRRIAEITECTERYVSRIKGRAARDLPLFGDLEGQT